MYILTLSEANTVGLENIGGWLKNRNTKDFK
jgi:hypothetical protein